MKTIEEIRENSRLRTRKWRLNNPNSSKEYYYSNHARLKEQHRINTEKWRRKKGLKKRLHVSKEEQRRRRNLWEKEYRKIKPPKKYAELTQAQKDKKRLHSKTWRQKNPSWKSKRKILLSKSTIGDFAKQIKVIYLQAKIVSLETGVSHEVDHIIPIQGKDVCGLNVPWNLRIIPFDENRKKSNKVIL